MLFNNKFDINKIVKWKPNN